MARTVSIVGAGRVGKSLGKRLRELGWRIGAVVTASTARAAVRRIGGGTVRRRTREDRTAGHLIGDLRCTTLARNTQARRVGFVRRSLDARGSVGLSLSDDLIRALARLPSFHHARRHHAPSRNARRRRACHDPARGKDHPAHQRHARPLRSRASRAPRRLDRLAASHAGIRRRGDAESERRDLRASKATPRRAAVAQSLAKSLGGIPVVIDTRDKPAYHAAAVIAAGSAIALLEAGSADARCASASPASAPCKRCFL